MDRVAIVAGILLVVLVLWDTFETIVLSKTVQRRYTLTVLFYGVLWQVWKFLVRRTSAFRTWVLVSYGPISLLLLIVTWASILIFGFAFINFGLATLKESSFYDYLYFSGVTFVTLGYGDVVPHDRWGHFLSVVEGGTGFGFLAIVIGYLPVLYNAFSKREAQITLLDARAGSNPSAGELLRRHGRAGAMASLEDLLKQWEYWSAVQLEAYLSYPIFAYYRSQHDDQSWLTALTCIMDTCSLISLGFEDETQPWVKPLRFQADLTFAMARHVVVDLAYIEGIAPVKRPWDRLDERSWARLQEDLRSAGIPLRQGREARLAGRRSMYEGYVVALARDLFYTVPSWVGDPESVDHWQVSAWDSPAHFSSSDEIS